VFIHYSGHGTRREVIDPVDGSRMHREALVPSDARAAGDEERLIFDWELSHLIGKIAERTPAVTVVLDCCCAAGAVRDVPEPGVSARFVEFAEPLVLPPDVPRPPATRARGMMGELAVSTREFMVVAACLDNELARESSGGDAPPGAQRRHGLLTRALLEELNAVPDRDLPDLRWGRIWRAVTAEIERMNAFQHPWLSSNPARRVFGGPEER
jgi:hypothetical protein